MKRDKQQRQRPAWHGHADKFDPIGPGVFKLNGEDRDLVFIGQRLKHPPMASANRIHRDHPVVNDCDAH